ncbi:uncharacterized protein LOC131314298 [Rhododendron vialii]|uniref:uncharacterized protein LOC131314298 n=1 Tax=Rhododendron vialii TaxID=182163 RepID=UPI00265F3C0E|nr:uncharacterized protein LOC131314298 [Rhododendron vialii]
MRAVTDGKALKRSSMAAEIGNPEGKRRRKKPSDRPKLLVNDRVEVRSVEEGYQGSWHPGTVIAYENRARRIKFDHHFCENVSRQLKQRVKVPAVVDGIIPASWDLCNYRGSIRPTPPRHDFQKCSLHFGLCVDVYYDEAWWEGVIFDHEDDSEVRTIFFPDIGDEMQIGIDKFRVTYDWDEFTEDWKPRGDWLFLDLVQEIEQQWPLQVSLRQIWYEVREKKGFQKLEQWTSTNRAVWKQLVWDVIVDNCHISVHHFFQVLELPGDLVQGVLPPVAEAINLDGSTSMEEDGRKDSNLLSNSDMPCDDETPSKQDEFCGLSLNSESKSFSSPGSITPGGKFEHQGTGKSIWVWRPADLDIVPRPEFCPNSVTEYCSRKHADTSKLRMHLAYLGWKIEFVRENSIRRMRYTSPDGKLYYSLVKVCEALMDPTLHIVPFSSPDNTIISSSERQFFSPISEQSHARQKPSSSDIVVGSEYCPQAIVDYVEIKKKYLKSKVKVLQLRAKMHLSAIGWSLWYVAKSGGMGRELRYSSPSGKLYYSLRAACEGCMMEGGVTGSNASESRPNISEEARCLLGSERLSSKISDVESGKDCLVGPFGALLSKELVELCKPPVKENKKLWGKRINGLLPLLQRKGRNAYKRMPKKRKTSRSLIKLRHDLDSEFPVRVLRSSKRARQGVASSSSYQNAQTILSWLIDNNVLLPRAKVRYISRKNNHPLAEGKITRDGIKCSCCHKVFTLSKFEAHAGSTYHRPAANIFLEDGRSLLDCQSELKSRNSQKNTMMEPHEMKGSRHHGTNDYVCTVCHAGGDLILCDQCPSSFHTSCLGMKDVPDGDWFCPSCCCQICGRSRLNNDMGNCTDVSVLSCDQCEHQYHVGCLRGVAIVDKHPRGSWFCSKGCKKISLGLHKLLGKSVSVSGDNVTWTLLKYIKCDADDHDGYDTEALTENYSKLNVALSVMHECFEPVKEPGTRRDLVEDVIFSRWSELNRLNFQGFYTVLLEKDDELISAATVRVHGAKVAEVPLVGTRFKFRRLGMCRILIEELEKKLQELGVERLVLPAVPDVLNTWTTSFGFSQMTNEERLNFLDCTFLDFQGTVMCQKLLRKIPSTDLRLIIRTQQNIHSVVSGSDCMDLDGNSAISEAFQADKVEKSEIVDQEPPVVAGDDGSDGGSVTAPPGFELNQPNLELIPYQNGHKENNDNSSFKCYKRRRISDCRS